MFCTDKIEQAIRNAFERMDSEEQSGFAPALLEQLDMKMMAQAIRQRAETVYQYRTEASFSDALVYRGAELFPQRACLICVVPEICTRELVSANYLRELWLLENMSFVEVTCLAVSYRSNFQKYVTEYRTVKDVIDEDDWLDIDPETVAIGLNSLCGTTADRRDRPLYEM